MSTANCPFCGEKDEFEYTANCVVCVSCKASGPLVAHLPTTGSITEAWNKRATLKAEPTGK